MNVRQIIPIQGPTEADLRYADMVDGVASFMAGLMSRQYEIAEEYAVKVAALRSEAAAIRRRPFEEASRG